MSFAYSTLGEHPAEERTTSKAKGKESSAGSNKISAEGETLRLKMVWSAYVKNLPLQGHWYSYSPATWTGLKPSSKQKIQHIKCIKGDIKRQPRSAVCAAPNKRLSVASILQSIRKRLVQPVLVAIRPPSSA